MDTIHVNWPQGVVRFDKIKTFKHGEWDLDKKGFYAVLGGIYNNDTKQWQSLKLLYIGQAFDQTLRERIPQPHPAYNCAVKYQKEHSGVEFVVMIGFIEKSTVEKKTQELFDDAECCLIYCNQPLCNTTCKEAYSGRDLQIINTGDHFPLKEKCLCSRAQ
jgi:hypothetical protein